MGAERRNPKILIVAGELSGDLHASLLVKEIQRKRKDVEFIAFGAHRLRQLGVRILCDTTRWGGIGFLDNFMKLPQTLSGFRLFKEVLEKENPDLFLPVDFRFFNLRASALAKRKGIPVVYYVSPVVWGVSSNHPLIYKIFPLLQPSEKRNKKRYLQVKKVVDFAFCIYPFAVPDYQKFDIPFLYIGHPVLEMIRKRRKDTGSSPPQWGGSKMLSVFPGSREMEVRRHLPIILKSLQKIHEHFPDLGIWISCATPALKDSILRSIKKIHGDLSPWLHIWEGETQEVMEKSIFAIVTSGTAVHEAMAVGLPSVVVYRVHPLIAWISRLFFMNLPYWSFPNLLAGKCILPELIQEKFTPQNLYTIVKRYLTNQELWLQSQRELLELSEQLIQENGLQKAADKILLFLPA